MDNRHLSTVAVSRGSERAESTINQRLSGKLLPTVEILRDIAPVLQMPLDDLLVIAGVSSEPAPDRHPSRQAPMEIDQLVTAASSLTPEQIGRLVNIARNIKAAYRE